MGWKVSMVIIENKNNFNNDIQLIKKLGFNSVEFIEETTFEECIYPNDKTLNIGYYNGNIIICDDYQIIENSLTELLSFYEKELIELFPKSEIIEVACHSTVNWHSYSVIQNAKKIRTKSISPETEKVSFGQYLEEEKEIYKNLENDKEQTEDELMEDFTFEIAKRRLGFRLDMSDNEDWMNVQFKKYKVSKPSNDSSKFYRYKTEIIKKQRDSFGKRLLKAFLFAIMVIVIINIIHFVSKLFN